jgi:hypothetical protein
MTWKSITDWKRWRAIFSPAGVSMETIILSIAVALLLGVFPMYGCPTLLCAAAAVLFRLNMPAMQAVNLISSPLQFALWMPFGRLGGRLLHLPYAPHLAARIGQGILHAVVLHRNAFGNSAIPDS